VELAQLKAELAEVQERVAAERELFIKLNELGATSPGVAVAETLAEVAAKVKDTVRDLIAPEPATKEPDREPTDWKRMLVDRDYRRQKQEERERRQQQEPERQQGREDAGGRSRDRS